jgi:hypothetical protein
MASVRDTEVTLMTLNAGSCNMVQGRYSKNIVACRGIRVTIIAGSILDDWIYWHFGYNLS